MKFLVVVNMGQSPSSDDCNQDGFGLPFLQGNAEFGKLWPTAINYCHIPRKIANPGDLLLSVRAPVGALNIADQVYGIGRGLCSLRASTVLSRSYLWWLIPVLKTELDTVSTGSTFEAVSAEQVRNTELYLPCSMSEQETIANFLDHETAKIDALIDKQQQLIALLKEKRQAVISHAVTKGLNSDAPMKDSGVEWLGEVPKHWGIKKAKYLFEEQNRPVRDTDEIVTVFRDGQVCLRSSRRMTGFTIAILEHGYQGIRKGDLILHSMDAFAGAIGVSEDDGRATPEYVVTKPFDEGNNCEYYADILRLMAQRDFIFVICSSVRERAPRFRFSKFQEVVLPVPPPPEQEQISRYLNKVTENYSKIIVRAEEQILLLQERRKALISAAVTGKIDVRNWQPPSSNSTTSQDTP